MSNETYDDGAYAMLDDFNAFYKDAHPYLSVIISICGINFNICNIIVLTRPAMNANPINVLLTVIAIFDAAVMISYIPFAVWITKQQTDYCDVRWQSFSWACFVLFHSALTVICHAASIWLTVALAFVRAITVRQMALATIWTARNSYLLSLITLITVIVLYVPGLLTYTVVGRSFNLTECLLDSDLISNETMLIISDNVDCDNDLIYITTVSPIASTNEMLLLKMAFWINGVLFKTVPCILLTIFIGVLLRILTEVKKRKIRLRTTSTKPPVDAPTKDALTSDDRLQPNRSNSNSTSDQRADRTTSMLIVLLSVFVLAELPQGLLSIITGLSNSEFRTKVFMNLGILTDLLSLINSAANFVIYCAMSQRFREVFVRTFCPTKFIDFRAPRHVYEPGDPTLYATAAGLNRRSTPQWSAMQRKDENDSKNKENNNKSIEKSPTFQRTASEKSSNGVRKPNSDSLSPLLKPSLADTVC